MKKPSKAKVKLFKCNGGPWDGQSLALTDDNTGGNTVWFTVQGMTGRYVQQSNGQTKWEVKQ
jgi:hypothetical protein